MAHLCFNILQPVLNLLRFWLMAGVAGLEPTDAGVKVLCLTTLAIPQYYKAPKMLLNPLSYSSNFWLTKSDSNR